MDGGRQTDPGVAEPSRASGIATIGWLLAALLTHLLLLDAAVETFRGGSPFRWWISPGLLAFMALSIWLWRPGGKWLRRHGPAMAAMTPLFGLLAALAVTAWLPGGQAKGIRLMSQTTSTVLTLAAIPAVVLATFVILEAMALVPSRWRSIARAVFVLLCAYAVVALVAALRDRTPYPALFRGGAVWSRLPFWLQGTFVGLFGLVPVALVGQVGRFAARLKGHQPPRILGRQAVALVLALAMSLPPVSVPGASVPGANLAGAAAAAHQARGGTAASSWRPPAGQIRNLFRALDAATKRIDRTSFDPVAVVEKVGSRTDALFVWVRDNTRWVPYRGALRGPVGVLMDRSGNSLDRALLLGELLQLGGHTARLARAQVPAATAEGWLARMPKRPVGPSAQAPPIDTLLASADSTAGESGSAPPICARCSSRCTGPPRNWPTRPRGARPTTRGRCWRTWAGRRRTTKRPESCWRLSLTTGGSRPWTTASGPTSTRSCPMPGLASARWRPRTSFPSRNLTGRCTWTEGPARRWTCASWRNSAAARP